MAQGSDTATRAQDSYGIKGIAHMVVIGRSGQNLRVHRGYPKAGVDDGIEDLNEALAE